MGLAKFITNLLIDKPEKKTPTATKLEYNYSESDRKKELLRDRQQKWHKYYDEIEQIESKWSVISNLKLFVSDQANEFEEFCKQNISLFYDCINAEMAYSGSYPQPLRVPAFVRLAMLYENRKDYDNAISTCVEAISVGATLDSGKGMQGRLARIIRKSGIEVSPEVLALVSDQ